MNPSSPYSLETPSSMFPKKTLSERFSQREQMYETYDDTIDGGYSRSPVMQRRSNPISRNDSPQPTTPYLEQQSNTSTASDYDAQDYTMVSTNQPSLYTSYTRPPLSGLFVASNASHESTGGAFQLVESHTSSPYSSQPQYRQRDLDPRCFVEVEKQQQFPSTYTPQRAREPLLQKRSTQQKRQQSESSAISRPQHRLFPLLLHNLKFFDT